VIDSIPGILETNMEDVALRVSQVSGCVSWVQIDIADGSLVPLDTHTDIQKMKMIIGQYPHLSFEAHLMVSRPEKLIRDLADAGFTRLIAHVECDDPRLFLEECKGESVEVGLAIDGMTELDAIEPFLEELDLVLIMTIEAGASGQPFLPETVEKIKTLSQNAVSIPIEVDGGMTPETVKIVRDAGANFVVSTSYIFTHPGGVAEAINDLKNHFPSSSKNS
jgi:ribulose-phosphate 3-epimerase